MPPKISWWVTSSICEDAGRTIIFLLIGYRRWHARRVSSMMQQSLALAAFEANRPFPNHDPGFISFSRATPLLLSDVREPCPSGGRLIQKGLPGSGVIATQKI